MRIKNIISFLIIAVFAIAFVFSASPPAFAGEGSKTVKAVRADVSDINVARFVSDTRVGDIPIFGNFAEYYAGNFPNPDSHDKSYQNKTNFLTNKFVYRIILPYGENRRDFPDPNLFNSSRRKLGFDGFGSNTFARARV